MLEPPVLWHPSLHNTKCGTPIHVGYQSLGEGVGHMVPPWQFRSGPKNMDFLAEWLPLPESTSSLSLWGNFNLPQWHLKSSLRGPGHSYTTKNKFKVIIECWPLTSIYRCWFEHPVPYGRSVGKGSRRLHEIFYHLRYSTIGAARPTIFL